MATDRHDILTQVLALIQADAILGALQCEAFPSDPEEWLKARMRSQTGAVLVSYAGSREAAGEAGTPRDVYLDVVLLARRTAGHAGALDWMARIDACLGGARIVSSGQGYLLHVTDDEFLAEVNQVHQYLVRVVVQAI